MEFTGVAKLVSINPGIQWHGETRVEAVNLRLECIGDEALCDLFQHDLRSVFFNGSGFRNEPCPGPVAFDVEYKCHVVLKDLKFGDVIVDKFKLEPKDGRCVVLSCGLRMPTHDNDTSGLHHLLQTEFHAEITPKQGELFGDEDGGDEEKEN